jgi:hypothetical protein
MPMTVWHQAMPNDMIRNVRNFYFSFVREVR